MKTSIKQFLSVIFITLLVAGCGEATNNTGGNSTGDNKNSAAKSNTSAAAQDYCKKFDGGVFQFISEDVPENYRFTLMFHCASDSLKGLLFGPVPEGEEGMYYFKENLDSVQVKDDYITFSFVQSNLYEKPFTLANYDKNFKNKVVGRSNWRQYYKGKIGGDSIIFTCQSPSPPECYGDTLIFKKK